VGEEVWAGGSRGIGPNEKRERDAPPREKKGLSRKIGGSVKGKELLKGK